MEDLSIEEVLSTPRSPSQRAYIERVIGSIRRECLDHVIVFHKESLYRYVNAFVDYCGPQCGCSGFDVDEGPLASDVG